jgi:2-oxoglutarate ferredoxin oxidoreductase subunit delta
VAQVVIDRDRCKGCGLCVQACPQNVLAMARELNAKANVFARVGEPRHCIGCRLCCIACPDVAIAMRVTGTLYHYFAY